MLRKSKALILCMMLCIGLLVPIDSKASSTDFFVNFPEPTTSEYQGYITLLLQNKNTGNYALNTWFWNGSLSTIQNNQSVDVKYSLSIGLNTSTISISMFQANGINYPSCSLFSINNSGYYRYRGQILSQSAFTYTYSNDYIVGMKFKGNVYNCSLNREEIPFTINFNQDGSALLLQSQLDVLLDMYAQDSTMLSKIESILNNTSSISSKLDALQQLERQQNELLTENNTWLEKIFNWLEDSPEQEKETAQSQAGQSTSDAQASIEDKSAGFVDSVNGLASSMSYSGTQCAWTFPALYLPEIPGVMSRTQLTSEKPIDFAYWVNQIPSDVLLLVRSVLTIALIGYCFKEFYGVIEYVLTMRGGGNSE